MSSRALIRILAFNSLILSTFNLSAQEIKATGAADATNSVTRLPAITVTAEKGPESAQVAPISVTAVSSDTIKDEDIRTVKDAAIYAPNVFMNEFTARKLSNPFFRGIGSSPNNPGITTYIDGVPQLNANSSSIELVDVDQLEFARGSQGSLYGRNTIGGLINITSRKPSLTDWRTEFETEYGNYNFYDERLSVSGPIIKDQLGFSAAGGYTSRDGFTVNRVTGHDLDSREDFFTKEQFLLKASDSFDIRLIVNAEHDNDGDYALGDLASIRQDPFHVSRDFEGYTHRDVVAPTLLATHHGDAIDLSSITGVVLWQTRDLTDLDYTALPLITRDNQENELQFAQEFRAASAKDAPLELTRDVKFKWQTGVFIFDQNYSQVADNNFAPGVLYQANEFGPGVPPISSPANTLRSQASLDDWGVGAYLQGTFTVWDRLDLTLGLRGDFEDKSADLRTFYKTSDPILGASGAPVSLSPSAEFSEVSPHGAISYRVTSDQTAYFSVTRGYKAGGFNPISPVGSESYGQEHSMDYEVGYKTRWLDGKLQANVALFYIDWEDLQLNVPVITSPGRYYISNVGAATSKGVEFDVAYRPVEGWDLFGSVGYTYATFGDGSEELGADISGNRLPYTPSFTGNAGTQYSWAVCKAATLYARAEVSVFGDFVYDSSNAQAQATYSLANFRAGVRGLHWFAEGWVSNAFDTHYVPIAIPYSRSFASSGYLGESGSPLTFGLRAGVKF